MIIDTHCHIDLYQNPRNVLQECVKADLTILSMTNLPSHFEMGYSHFKSLKKIRLALGMHPLMADFHKLEFDIFLQNLDNTSYIGEIGLDYSKEGISTKAIQLDTFSKILKAISGKNKILSIHSRKAEKDVLYHLIENNIKSAIFHWYSGPINLISEISKAGYYFSINPSMIKSSSGKSIIAKIPSHLILTETDSPFIQLQGKSINPGEILSVIDHLANIWEIDSTMVQKQINNNFRKLISVLK